MSLRAEIQSIDGHLVERAVEEVAGPACGGVREAVEAGALADYPVLAQILDLIDLENERRGMSLERSEAITLGATIMALAIKNLAEAQELEDLVESR